MKSVILLALVAFAAASQFERSTVGFPFHYQGQYQLGQSEFFGQGNTYHVPQYVAYQFHQAQQLGYTPTQVAQYLLQHGFPESVAQYFAQQYEAGLSQSYFQSPYEIFQYYNQHGVSQEAQQYIAQQIARAFQQFQQYYSQYGQQAYEHEYPGVAQPFAQYAIQQGRYYAQNGYTYSAAQLAFQQLQQAEKFAQNALQFFANGDVQQQAYQYIYQQLQQGLIYVQKAQSVYQAYQNYQQVYVPYYAAQFYGQQAQQAYQYFLNAYQYIQQQGQVNFPQYFVQQVQYAYFAAQRAYQTYQQSQYGQGYFQGSYNQEYPQGSQNYIQALIQRYFNKNGEYQGYNNQYQYGPYSQGYGYQYRPYSQAYGYQYGPSAYQYRSTYGPYSSSAYQYGSYEPYSSSTYQYGPYNTYGYQYQTESYRPYQYGQHSAYQGGNSYGFGGYPYAYSGRFAQIAAASKAGEVEQAVKDAIDIGYRHIDCAHVYGNEKEVGAALTAKIADGTVKREEIWITSKLWNTYHRPDLVEKNLRMTLNDLGLNYLDLYLIHWPTGYKEDLETFPKDDAGNILFSDVDYLDTWKAMEELVNKGLVKAIGLSNFNKAQITRILENCKIPPAMLQIECHPYLNQSKIIEFAKSKDIAVTAYSPLGSPDRPWAKPGDPQLMEDPKLVDLAKKYSKTPAQILLRYQIERGVITIPKSVTKSRIQQNFEIFDFSLAPEDVAYLNTFDCNGRLCPLAAGYGHKYHPFEHDEV